jgi:hypothetical protein
VSDQKKPCMCGLPAQSYTTESANGVIKYAIGCNDRLCHWTAGEYTTEAEAIAAWNQRAGGAITSGYYQVEPIGEQPPTKTTVAVTCQGCQEKEAELVALRQEKNEAIGAALAVEQKCYDQAQEIKALRKLREAVETYFGKYPFSDIGNISRALAACDEASAPTGDEHTK